MKRNEAIASVRLQPDISVLIVGAGINGIGTFRDLALNGVDVLLVDRGDFCSGASAASSHMAHGGIRYLENGEFRLVREAVQERNRMIENAPHVVRPLPTTIPIFRVFSGLFNAPLKFAGILDRPSERGAIVIKIGLMLYDAYTGKQRTVPRHHFKRRKESLHTWSGLNPNVIYTATYFDGAILQPERLGLELVLDAEAENPRAVALNYVSLQAQRQGAVALRDELTGETLEVRPRVVVNASGPWIDQANGALGCSTRLIGGTKGSHVVLEHPELRRAIGDHEFFFENKDGRIVLIFPLYDRVLVGTTDIAAADPDAVRCTDDEVAYFLELVKRIFPGISVNRSHIVFRFSGVRPLAASASKTTGQITRDHQIHVLEADQTNFPFPIYSLVGGKWTSWRAFSEQATDTCLSRLGIGRKESTRRKPIGGGRAYPRTNAERTRLLERIAEKGQISTEQAEALFERYGTRAVRVAEVGAPKDAPLRSLPTYSRGEIQFMAQDEKVVHLDDVLLRRSMLAMLGRVTREAVMEIAGVLAQHLAWNEARARDEIARALEILKEEHQVQL